MALAGKAPPPFEFWIGRICEEFHCLPSEAMREWRTSPAGFLEDVMEARAYAQAWAMVDGAKSAKDIPSSPLTDLAITIRRELAEDELRDELTRRARGE